MVKKVKILPAVAALALGLTSFAGTNKASAYELHTSGANDVSICHTLNNIIAPVNTNYIFDFEDQSGKFNFSGSNSVVVRSGSVGTISNRLTSSFRLTMPFVVSTVPSNGSATVCAHLDFTNSFAANNDWSDEGLAEMIEVEESRDQGSIYPEDDTNNPQYLQFVYGLNVDNNNLPIPSQSGNDYQSLLSVIKTTPAFKSTMTYKATHFDLTKTVRGNRADPTKEFDFTVKVDPVGQAPSGGSYNISVYDGNNTLVHTYSCTIGTNCTGVKLKHGQTAKVGYSNSDQIYEDYYKYSVTENISSSDGYTTKYKITSEGVAGNETSGTSVTNRVLKEGDEVDFYNEKSSSPTGRFLVIFPFIILAVAATLTIIAVRKTSTKKEQA